MSIYFYNTAAKKKQLFKTIKKKKVHLYTCGPTVYDYSHIGNFRTFIFQDVLKKWLIFSGYKVKHVMNITDVDDKTIKRSINEGVRLKDLTTHYEQKFFEDLGWLKIAKADFYPRATDSISKIIEMISTLISKKYAYVEKDGSVYFNVKNFEKYGELSGLLMNHSSKSTRMLNDEYDKDSPQDFALWKSYKKSDGITFWDSPWGKGRPGWHIECSAMSIRYLGESFDIHCGGVDNIFPHHENEIAQSEGFTGKKFVNFWLHSEHLMIEKAKMSKSSKNFFTIRYLKECGFKASALRYLLLCGHYRHKLKFSLNSMMEGNRVIEKIENFSFRLIDRGAPYLDKKLLKEPEDCKIFKKHMNNDLDTPKALAVFFSYLKRMNKFLDNDKLAKVDLGQAWAFFSTFNDVFSMVDLKELVVPSSINSLLALRKKARANKDWKASDEIRSLIREKGYDVEDSIHGQRIKKIRL